MGHDVFDVGALPVEKHFCDQPVFVACDVEHYKSLYPVCRAELQFQFGKILCRGMLQDAMPVQQGLAGIWMLRPEGAQDFFGNDVHVDIIAYGN